MFGVEVGCVEVSECLFGGDVIVFVDEYVD